MVTMASPSVRVTHRSTQTRFGRLRGAFLSDLCGRYYEACSEVLSQLSPARTINAFSQNGRREAPQRIVEDRPPGLGALAAHALEREQDLLAVRAHADNDEQRDRGRFAVEPHAHHRA